MKFEPKGIFVGPELDEFRNIWEKYTGEESAVLSGTNVSTVSGMQLIVIHMFTGCNKHTEDTMCENSVIATDLPAQMELEALFRARSRALAYMFQLGKT